MFTQFIQRLTLIAFAVHAVLGCCTHHSHAHGSECCEHISTHQSDLHAGCETPHEHDGCSHKQDCAEISTSGGVVQNLAAYCYDLPGEHAHSCNEARCAYVIPSTMAIDFNVDVFVCVIDFAGSAKSLLSPSVRTNLRMCWAGQLWHFSSAQLCADLQSWQI